jgi:hypothetical protein
VDDIRQVLDVLKDVDGVRDVVCACLYLVEIGEDSGTAARKLVAVAEIGFDAVDL